MKVPRPLFYILLFLFAWLFAFAAISQPVPSPAPTNRLNRVTNNLVGWALGNDVDTQAGNITTSSAHPWVSKLDERFFGGTFAKSSSAVPSTGSNDTWMEIELPMNDDTGVSVPHRIMLQCTISDPQPGTLTNVFTILYKAHANDPYQMVYIRQGLWTDNQDLWIEPLFTSTVYDSTPTVFFKFRMLIYPGSYAHTYAAVDWIQWEAVPQTLHKLRVDTTGGNALGADKYAQFSHGEYGHGWQVSWFWYQQDIPLYLQYSPMPAGPWTTATNALWQNDFTLRQGMYFPHDTANKFFRLHN